MNSTENEFDENKYREAVVKIAEGAKIIQGIKAPEFGELVMFTLHHLQVAGNLMQNIKQLHDLKVNPYKISTEVTPRARDEKPSLTIPFKE